MRFFIAALPVVIANLVLAPIPVHAEPPRVVVDIAPVHALLTQVMEGVGVPDLLLDQTANPHAVQLKPSQARMLAEADVLVWVGPKLSPWLERILDAQDGDNIALMEQPVTQLRDLGGDETETEHDHEGDHEDDHGSEDAAAVDADHAPDDPAEDAHAEEGHDGHEGHHHTGVDPHVWLSTENARAWLGVFADDLAARDPENAATYHANATAAQADLDALALKIENRLAPHKGAEIVTFHNAFGYFADEFGIDVVGSVRPSDAATPSAAAITELRGLVADHGIECAFAEPAFDAGLLDAIAGGTGLRIGTLDPIGALQPIGPGHYAATLMATADAIAECLERE